MNRTGKFTLLFVFLSLTACAPVVYENAYYDYGGPYYRVESRHNVNHASRLRNFYHPIEVTLYADDTYVGFGFSPISVVIYEGDYIEVPLRDKRGRFNRAFAHYYRGELHFDKDRNCNRLKGSAAFKYDQKWGKGRKYKNAIAGMGHDYNGINIQIRNSNGNQRIVEKKSDNYTDHNNVSQPEVKDKESIKTKRRVQSKARNKSRNGHEVTRVVKGGAFTNKKARKETIQKNDPLGTSKIKIIKKIAKSDKDILKRQSKNKQRISADKKAKVAEKRDKKKIDERETARNGGDQLLAGEKGKRLNENNTVRMSRYN